MSNVKKLMMTAAGGEAGPDVDDVFATYPYRGNGNQSSAASYTRKEILEDFQISDRIVVNGFSNDTSKEAIYTTTGTYSWTCPSGVTSVCVVCVGGGAGNAGGGAKAGGGGLGWKNDIPVTPGSSYTVVVGRAGPNGWQGGGGLNNGGDSYFINTSTVAGFGGKGYGSGDQGGGFVGDGGGSGGKGTYNTGGGAGGYLGNGGYGREHQSACNQTGKGGAGSGAPTWASGNNGGGVGIYGAGESGTLTQPYHGSVGNGAPSTAYGWGEGGSNGAGGGAVRIIWGSGRKFPFAAGYLSEQIPGTDSMVWLKSRDSGSRDHYLAHSEDMFFVPGSYPNQLYERSIYGDFLNAKSSGGVDIMHSTTATQNQNQESEDYCAWAWKKQEKFFDIVTYNGASSPQTISHNLGSTPGMIIVKRYNANDSYWAVYHRGANGGVDPEDYWGRLNDQSSFAYDTSNFWNYTAPTSTHFSVGTSYNTNSSGGKYVAYLFAHNNGDGIFGPDQDQDIIKCGYYNGNASTNNVINVGFEPQYIMIKKTNASGYWLVFDTYRGIGSPYSTDYALYPNTNNSEATGQQYLKLHPNGFTLDQNTNYANGFGDKYMYVAIRRGPLSVPENGTDVFAAELGNNSGDGTQPEYNAGFPVDMAISHYKAGGQSWYPALGARLFTDYYLQPANVSDKDASTVFRFEWPKGWWSGSQSSASVSWMWRRAPGYFDMTQYTGTGSNAAIPHTLGAVPEMVWTKSLDGNYGWAVYHKDAVASGATAATSFLRLDSSGAVQSGSGADYWNSTAPTSTHFYVGTDNTTNRGAGDPQYVGFVFASAPGVSKVGSYTGNGSSQNIDCGFSSGARFIMIKCIEEGQGGNWFVYDSVRGIVSGNDPRLVMDDNDPESTSYDDVDPYSAGFAVTGGYTNVNNYKYIFYAIA